MTHEKWFWSDPHLFHTNIIKFTGDDGKRIRPFNSLDEMHETMLENYNKLVGPNDYVYWLGDITFQYHKGFNELMSQFNGRKRLTPGNHDKIWNVNLMRWFEKCELWKGFKDHNFTACHMPLREDGFRDGAVNVHGHTHQRLVKGPYINVCVETRGYAPVHIDEIGKEINEILRHS